MTEKSGLTVSVVAAIVVGIGFVVLLSQASFQTSIGHYTSGLIDSINPRFGIDQIHNKVAVDIMLQNSTVVELLKDRDVYVSAIGIMPDGCSFGSCAIVHLWQRDDAGNFLSEQARVLVDYPNQRVSYIKHTDGW